MKNLLKSGLVLFLFASLLLACDKESKEDLIAYHKAEVHKLLTENNISEDLILESMRDIENTDINMLKSWKIQNESQPINRKPVGKERSCTNHIQLICYPYNSFTKIEFWFEKRSLSCNYWFFDEVYPYSDITEVDITSAMCDDDVYVNSFWPINRSNPTLNLLTWTSYFQCDCDPVDQDYKYVNYNGSTIVAWWSFLAFDYCAGTNENAVQFKYFTPY